MKNSILDIVWVALYFSATLGIISYNAYYHNFQLLALWIIVTAQTLALGGALDELRKKK